MRKSKSWVLVALLFMTVLAFQAEPTRAAFPERYSMVMVDFCGFLIDCLDLGRCDGQLCPATLFLSGKTGSCTQVDEFSPAKFSTTCTFNNFDYSFFAPSTRRVELDLTCSRWGSPWYWFGSASPPTGTCAVMSSQFRIDQYGANFTANESYTAATITRPMRCADLFAPLPTEPDYRDFNPRREVNRDRK